MYRDNSQCDKCGDKNRTPGKNLCQCSHVQGMDMDDLHLGYLAAYQLCMWFPKEWAFHTLRASVLIIN